MEAILFGNGFNLLSGNCPSWQSLLNEISANRLVPKLKDIVPNTYTYENIFLSPVLEATIENSKEEENLKNKVKNLLANLIPTETYKDLLDLEADCYLTTNYDNTIFNNKKKFIKAWDRSENLYSIRRWRQIETNDHNFLLFQIHGDVDNVKSIMLGLDHYTGSLAKVQDYVKGIYQREPKDKKKEAVAKSKGTKGDYFKYYKVPPLIKRLNGSIVLQKPEKYGFENNGTGLLSWIDAFFFSNLHIIGFNLDFSEVDIWWLLVRRARLMKDSYTNQFMSNKIYYYPVNPTEEELKKEKSKINFLKTLGVEICLPDYDLLQDPTYNEVYSLQIQNIRDRMIQAQTAIF